MNSNTKEGAMAKVLLLIAASALALMWLLLMAVSSHAAPYLVSDPMPEADQVTHFELYFDGSTTAVVSPAVNRAIKHSLATIANGPHTVQARACNVWACGLLSNKLEFIKVAPGTTTITIISQ